MPSNIELKEFVDLARSIESNFFTMDIAKTIEGKWIVIELGDGQVSGLPYNADLNIFYLGILKQLRR